MVVLSEQLGWDDLLSILCVYNKYPPSAVSIDTGKAGSNLAFLSVIIDAMIPWHTYRITIQQ